MNLFQSANFKSHSGLDLTWKIETDALTALEWYTLSQMILELSVPFRNVIGIPRGGVKLGQHLNRYSTGIPTDPILIVDDVLTTGGSMEEFKQKEQNVVNSDYIGWVVFARNTPPKWCNALFQMPFNPNLWIVNE